jgi:hypothetical protein
VLTTFADSQFSGSPSIYAFSGSSDDDDDDDDCSSHSSEEDGDDGSSSITGDDNAVPALGLDNDARFEQVTRNWKRGAISDSTLGEWARVHGVLQKWYHEQEDGFRVFLGPLTRPYSR